MADPKEHPQQNILNDCAVQAKGLVTEVSEYENPNTRQFIYSVHLVVPGCSQLKIKIKRDPSYYRERIGTVVPVGLIVRENKFGTFLEEA